MNADSPGPRQPIRNLTCVPKHGGGIVERERAHIVELVRHAVRAEARREMPVVDEHVCLHDAHLGEVLRAQIINEVLEQLNGCGHAPRRGSSGSSYLARRRHL